MRTIVATLTIFLTVCYSCLAADPQQPFIGTWQIDVAKSLEKLKSSPKYEEDEADTYEKVMTDRASKLRLKISENELVFLLSQKEVRMPYTVIGSKENTLVTTVTSAKGEDATVTFTTDADGSMNYTSNKTDDMDYYIWTRVESETE